MASFVEITAQDLPKIRAAYEQANNNKAAAKALLGELNNVEAKSAIAKGYKGAVTMMMAKFSFNPIKKFEAFSSGKNILETAIKQSKDNMELIFIRFSVQSNTPSFLNYNDNLIKDKTFLLVNINSVADKDLQRRIANFLKTSPLVTSTERNLLP